MLIECNTFQKDSADSKVSTNRYLTSVTTVFRKLKVKVDVTKLQPHYVRSRGAGLLSSGTPTKK